MPLADVHRHMRQISHHTCHVDERDAFSWRVCISASSCPERLRSALLKARHQEMRWHLRFDAGFPASPPRVRVESPKFERGTAHVLEGGALCAQLLADAGWAAACQAGAGASVAALVESLLALMDDGGPRVTRARALYDEETARESFERAKRQHGW